MLLKVRVIPNSRKTDVRKEGGILKIRVAAKPDGGKANSALIDVLSEFLGARKSSIRIVKGLKSRDKVVEVAGI